MKLRQTGRAGAVFLAAMIGGAGHAPMAAAQEQSASYDFAIAAKPVSRGINEIGQVTGLSVILLAEGPARGLASATGNPVRGPMSAEAALSQLLAGTGLGFRFVNAKTIQVYPLVEDQADLGDDVVPLAPMIVLGKLAYSGAVEGYLAPATETGVKSGVPLSEVPQSISVVTSTELEDRKPRQVEDAIKYTAGVNASTWGTDDRYDQFAIRGFDLGTGSIYRDGLPQKASSFSAFKSDPYMLERVDVLRGPAGILYGSNDAGGMVNLVTKRPVFERAGEVRLSYGSHDTASLGFDYSDALNEAHTLAGRITGLVRNGATQAKNSNNDTSFVAGGLTWAPSDYTSLTALASIQRDSLSPLNMVPVAGEDYDAAWGILPDDWGDVQPSYNQFKTLQKSAGWEFSHEFSPALSFNQRFRYARQSTDYKQLDLYGAYSDGLYYYPFIVEEEATTLGLDNNLEWRRDLAAGENTLTLGADFQRTRNDATNYMDYATYTVSYTNPSFDFAVTDPALATHTLTTYRETGIYLQDHLRFDSGTSLTFGLRRAWMRNEVEDYLAGTTETQSNAANTGMIGLTHEFGNGLTPYLSYTRGFEQNVGRTITGDILDPSESRQWEAGLRYQPNSDLMLTAAVFDLRKTNVKDYDQNDPTFQSFTQAGEIRSRGLELEARGRLTETLQGTASYSYLDTKIIRSADESLLGNQNAMAPNHQLSFWLDYDAKAIAEGLTLGFGMRYVSDAYSTQENLRKTKGYTLADLSVGYEVGNTSFDLGVTNLFDKEYYGVCYDNYGCATGEGRIATLTVSRRF